jgi:hypothetical protein
MGNEISALCSCNVNKKESKLEHTINQPQPNLNYKALERVKNKLSIDQPEEDTLNYEDGSKYIGYTKDGMREGKGKLLTLDYIFEGEFQKNQFHGNGKLENSNMLYDGNFVNGEKNGRGTLTLKEEEYKYIGEWKDGNKDGLGNEYLPDKSYYEGNFVTGKKNGKGKLILSNGSIYEGEFKDDKLDGNGVLKWSENKVYEGQWKDSCLSGLGKLTNKNKVYIGYFENDKKHGFGISIDTLNNSKLIGTWDCNVLEGYALYITNKKEEIWIMKKNKIKKKITDAKEIKKLKETEEMKKIENTKTLIEI